MEMEWEGEESQAAYHDGTDPGPGAGRVVMSVLGSLEKGHRSYDPKIQRACVSVKGLVGIL